MRVIRRGWDRREIDRGSDELGRITNREHEDWRNTDEVEAIVEYGRVCIANNRL